MEIIIINDGSTDNTKEICQCFVQNDSRIQVINQDNKGVFAARNKGIRLAHGKYIMFLDSDDTYDNEFIELMCNYITIKNVDLVICGQIDVIQNKTETDYLNKIIPRKKLYKTRKEFLNDYIYNRNQKILDTLWNKIYKLDIIRSNKLFFEDIKLSEDVIFNLTYYNCIQNCYILNKALYYYKIDYLNPKEIKYKDIYFECIKNEYTVINNQLRIWNIYNREAQIFQTNKFIVDLLLYIDYLISIRDRNKIKIALNDKVVQEAISYYGNISMKKRIIAFVIKYKQIYLLKILRKITSKTRG